MTVISYNVICLAHKSTINKFIVISILPYQIQTEIRVFAQYIPGSGNDFQEQLSGSWGSLSSKYFFIFKQNLC